MSTVEPLPVPRASLAEVTITGELATRPPRPREPAAEAAAYAALAHRLTVAPDRVHQAVVDAALRLCGAGSTGISLRDDRDADGDAGGPRELHWPALAGALAGRLAGTVPAACIPCGDVLRALETRLYAAPARHFAIFDGLEPLVLEGLVAPIRVGAGAIGTLWAMSHDPARRFDREDARVLETLAAFAAAACRQQDAARTEAVRRAAERRYRALARSLPGGAVFLLDTELRYRLAEGDALATLGQQPADYEGRRFGEVLGLDRVARLEPLFRRAVEGESFETEETFGERRYLVRAAPLRDERGAIAGVAAMLYDHTERLAAEEGRRASERRLDAVLANTTAAILLMDERQHCVYMNAAAERLTGYTLAEATGRPLHDVVHHTRPDGRPYPLEECPIDRAFPANLQEQGEETFVHRDGSFYPVAFTASPVRDGDTRIVGTVVEVRDLRAERAAREMQQKLVHLVEHSDDFIGLANLDGRLEYLNPAARRMIGLAPDADPSRVRMTDYVAPGSLDFFRNVFLKKVVEDGRCQAEMQLRNVATGALVDVARTTFVVTDPVTGVPLGYGTVTRDVTAHRAAERALREADRRKDEFLATLAHELRNPLAPIRNAVRVLASASGGEREQQWSRDVIDRQVRTMARLLDDLLDVSRITRGRLELRRERVLLTNLVEDAVETSRPLIEARRHRLAVRLPDEPVRLDADPVRLCQALANLLTNAAKYTPPGGRIDLEVVAEPERVKIAVRDSGIGLAADSLAHVFEMFTQLEPGRAQGEGGLGIGLALVKGLVELHGGTVEAASPGPGFGSTFTMTLPRPPASPPRAGDAARAPAPAHGASRRVLIADDNRDNARSLAMLLELEGHDVRVAHAGDEALRVAAGFAPEVAFLDIGMPGMDGYALAECLRALPLPHRPTLVAVTGWGQADDKRRALAAGFDQHLTKPVDPDVLSALLKA